MGKRIAILLMLLAAAVLLPFTAVLADEFDNVPVTSDGVTQKLHWDKLNIRNGKMVVTVTGFNEVKGKDFGMLSVVAEGKEFQAKSAKDDKKGNCVYSFDCSAMPGAMWFYPADGGARVLLWKDSKYMLADPWIPADYAGVWKGTAIPADGGTELELTCELRTDGTGTYSYRSGENAAMLPFSVRIQNRLFTAEIAGGVMPVTEVKGTWKLQQTELLLEARAVYRDGEDMLYSVKLSKSNETNNGD